MTCRAEKIEKTRVLENRTRKPKKLLCWFWDTSQLTGRDACNFYVKLIRLQWLTVIDCSDVRTSPTSQVCYEKVCCKNSFPTKTKPMATTCLILNFNETELIINFVIWCIRLSQSHETKYCKSYWLLLQRTFNKSLEYVTYYM